MHYTELYGELMAAYVRGFAAGEQNKLCLPREVLELPLRDLSREQTELLYEAGRAAELKLYRFKNSHDLLPRVRKVLGFLKGISFDSLLDIGSGRGVFLFPFLEAFPWVNVCSADILDYRVQFLQAMTAGGLSRLTAVQADICDFPFEENSFDVVSLLEVLEHIPQVEKAVQAAVRAARQFVVVSVPSHEDNNPEHIHLLTKERLTALFTDAGCKRLSFDGVNGHLIMIARKEAAL